MKVIAKIDISTYICEVRHEEIEKYMNLYYDNMKKLHIGQEVSLSEGYDFKSETLDALRETKNFIKANSKIIDAILKGIKIAGKK